MNNRYRTKDIGEAAVLLSKGFNLLDTEWEGEVAYFLFNNREEAEKIAYAYQFGGATVVARTFHDNMILIKRKILARYNPEKFKKDIRSYSTKNRS